jgi:nucleotide-binding universal stress UspA family protein
LKILLAIDRSPVSKAAVAAVIDQLPRQNTEVRVLHVVEPPAAAVRFVIAAAEQLAGAAINLEPEAEALSKEAEALVTKTADELRRQGFSVSSAIEHGDAKSKILETAAQWDADLIVMGSHARGAMDRLFEGSVSAGVVQHAQCSVEIVRAHCEDSEQMPASPDASGCSGL